MQDCVYSARFCEPIGITWY